MRAALTRLGVLLLVLLCATPLAALAENVDADKTLGTEQKEQSDDTAIATVEAELAAAKEKLAAGPSGSPSRMLGSGVATQEELDEWTLLLNLRISSLEKHLDALRSLEFEIQSRKEMQTLVQDWTGFAQPPPYSIDFIDNLWGDLLARQRDIEASQVAHNLISTQIDVLRRNLESLQKAQRQAAEQVRGMANTATPEYARRVWLSELADTRVRTTLTTLAQYEAAVRFNKESLARVQQRAALLQRQIEVATQASPLSQADLDGKLASNQATRVALEQELIEVIGREQQAQENVRKARAELLQRQAEAKPGDTDDQARIEFAQDMLEARKAQADTAILRQEAVRLLMDVTRSTERIWRDRFEVAHEPSIARLREMRALLSEANKRITLWKQFLSNSLDAANGLYAAAEKRLADAGSDSLKRTIAEAEADTYRERKVLYERLQGEVHKIELLLMRWEQGILAQDSAVPHLERFNDLLSRLISGAADLWNFEVFAVKDTITVDGQEITGTSSITIGKIITVVMILTLGLWAAAQASAAISLMLGKRLNMNDTAITLLMRGLYILSIIVLILIALDIVNIPLTVFAFLGGALAIGIGFGAQTLINNFISGLILLVERPISLGDLVEVEGVRGRVRNIGARCSRIRRADGIDMLVPNSVLLERNVTNLTLTDTQLRVSIKIGVAYGSPLRDVTRLLEETMQTHGKVLKDPQPLVLFEDFGDNALMFTVEFWLNVSAQTDSRVVASDLRHMIERQFREAGIVIAYPQRDLHLDTLRPLEVVVKSDSTGPEAATVPSPT